MRDSGERGNWLMGVNHIHIVAEDRHSKVVSLKKKSLNHAVQ